MSVTFCVFKWLTSRLVNDSQPANMPFMLITLPVSKVLRSRIFNLLQPNISAIFVTLLVSKWLRSRLSTWAVQNMPLISVTLLVFRKSRPMMLVTFGPANQPDIEVGRQRAMVGWTIILEMGAPNSFS